MSSIPSVRRAWFIVSKTLKLLALEPDPDIVSPNLTRKTRKRFCKWKKRHSTCCKHIIGKRRSHYPFNLFRRRFNLILFPGQIQWTLMVLALALLPSYLVVIMKWDQLVQGKLLTLLLDIVFWGGGGRVRTCSLQVMGLTSRPITLPRYRSLLSFYY